MLIVVQTQFVRLYTQASYWLNSILKMLIIYACYLLFQSPRSARLTNNLFQEKGLDLVLSSVHLVPPVWKTVLCEPCDLLVKI